MNFCDSSRFVDIRVDFFYVFLTVHLSIILGSDQLDTQLLYLKYVYYDPLHVSSTICSSSGG